MPEVGARVRHYHPWIDDYAVGTVRAIEPMPGEFTKGPLTFKRCRVLLTECMHWRNDGTWGPVPDIYFDNLAEVWSYEEDVQGTPQRDPAAESESML